MVFDFTQCWVNDRPGNVYFLIPHNFSDLLTPLRPLDLYPYLVFADIQYENEILQQIEAIPPSAVCKLNV